MWYENAASVRDAILVLHLTWMNGYQLKCSFGTTKYCNNFLTFGECLISTCTFLHYIEKSNYLVLENTEEFHAFLANHHILLTCDRLRDMMPKYIASKKKNNAQIKF